ncbi:MAG: glycosyltransferase [Ktedonobacteraceae bacterium]|nr:glycosyltransferase [Ktedonobacteraceae bacterium]
MIIEITYILPIKHSQPTTYIDELTCYLRWLAEHAEVLVIDGSPPDVFAIHAAHWNAFAAHRAPDADIHTLNGKVQGVLTGLRYARHEKLVIADDDVRYDEAALRRIAALLEDAHVVRPQNYFEPRSWHTLWDSGRTLLNRMSGGDWPGTLGVRRSVLQATGGYDGNVLFENLELIRTVRAAGGREVVPLDLFVRRLPPSVRHFWSQRIRQAYDEFARPLRLAMLLSLLPLILTLILLRRRSMLAGGVLAVIGLAELGRRRAGGREVFPFAASLLAPAWLVERALCIWVAVGMRLFAKGMPYRMSVITRAATPMNVLRQLFREPGKQPGAIWYCWQCHSYDLQYLYERRCAAHWRNKDRSSTVTSRRFHCAAGGDGYVRGPDGVLGRDVQ